MKNNTWGITVGILLTALLLAFCMGCSVLGFTDEAEPTAVPTENPGRIPDNAVTLDLRGAGVTAEEIEKLLRTSTLTTLDVRDNDISVETFNRLSAALPNCDIVWSVPFGAKRVDSNSSSLTVSTEDDPTTLMQVLPYLPTVKSVDMASLSMETEQLLTLEEAFPNVQFSASVSMCGISVDTTATEIDLSTQTGVSAYTTDELVTALRLFPAVTEVNLKGQTLSFEEMDQLSNTYPDVRFQWAFTFLDVPCTSEDTFLDLSGKAMTSTDEVAKILPYMPALTALDMCDCGLSNEQMGALREQFPNIAINWRIQVGRWSMRTDVTAFSTGKTHTSSQVVYDKKNGTNVLKTEHIAPLQYCTEMVALDIGHQKIDDISVVSNMKKLRFLIIADGKFTDISPVAGCTSLEFLEVFQNYISDFSPLLSLSNLKCLNCGATKSPDKAAEDAAAAERLKVLEQMTGLSRLWVIHAGFDNAQIDELHAALPDCMVVSGGAHPTASGWRADNELYVEMQELFELKVLN